MRFENKIGLNYTPKEDLVFRFLKNDLHKIKVVILGLDPYTEEGIATGRCFEVANLDTWDSNKVNNSLRNIARVIYKLGNNKELVKFTDIKEKIRNDENSFVKPNKMFDIWESEGVLLF